MEWATISISRAPSDGLDAAAEGLDGVGHREGPARAALARARAEAGEVRGYDLVARRHEGGHEGGIGA